MLIEKKFWYGRRLYLVIDNSIGVSVRNAGIAFRYTILKYNNLVGAAIACLFVGTCFVIDSHQPTSVPLWHTILGWTGFAALTAVAVMALVFALLYRKERKYIDSVYDQS